MLRGRQCAVVGSGVIGLTTAIRLTEQGANVRIYARDRPPKTTSNVACALFLPLWIDPKSDNVELSGRALSWSYSSWERFAALEKESLSGIRRIKNYELVMNPREADEIAGFFSRVSKVYDVSEEVIAVPRERTLIVFETFLIETPSYMEFLVNRCKANNCEFETRNFESLKGIGDLREEVVFNCLGLGSREIFSDQDLMPVKGQISLIDWKHVPPLNVAVGDNELCLIPRSDHLILGSLFQTTFRNDKPDVDAHVQLRDAFRSRGMILPELEETIKSIERHEPVALLAGLRPVRNGGVRIAREELFGKAVIHNYGHGGSGITISWGTVDAAIGLIEHE